MALPHVGNQHPKTFPNGGQTMEILGARNRIFHKVDRSIARGLNHSDHNKGLSLAEYILVVWSPKVINIRQRDTVHRYDRPRRLQELGNSSRVLFC